MGDASHEYSQDYASLGVPLDGQQVFVSSTLLSPNVYYLTGGSHHTMVVGQSNGIVVIEGPLYEARSQAVIDWIKVNLPGKPITHVVSTHFHSDHASGLRTFVAAGATIVAGAAAAPFYKKVFQASSTVVPDPLAVTPEDREHHCRAGRRLLLD